MKKRRRAEATSSARASRPALDFFLPGLFLVTALVSHLRTIEYPILRVEVALLLTIGIAISVPIALLLRNGKIARLGLIAVMLSVFLKFALPDVELEWIGLASIAAVVLLRRGIVAVLAAGLAVAAAAAVLVPRSPTYGIDEGSGDAAATSSLAPVLHIVLDEQIGLAGLPLDFEGTREVRDELADLLRRHRFRSYPLAFSQYENTHNSMANLLNFESRAVDAFHYTRKEPYLLEQNEYFQYLEDLGYELHVWQPYWVRYCGEGAWSTRTCRTYTHFITGDLEAAEIQGLPRTALLAASFLSQPGLAWASRLYGRLRAGIDGLPEWPFWSAKVTPLSGLQEQGDLRSALADPTEGKAFFAHLMLPHGPLALDRDCHARRIGEWIWGESTRDRETSYSAYAEQVRCTIEILDQLLTAFLAAADRATVILHGDHGSRLQPHPMRIENEALLRAQDYRDAYSTLFAARTPDTEIGEDPRMLALQDLLAATIGQRHAATTRSVFLSGKDSGPMREVRLGEDFAPLSQEAP